MEQLLLFIETMAIDDKMTWRVNGKRSGELFEVSWNRALAPTAWGIRRGYEESFEMFSNQDFRIALKYSEIDLAHLEKSLSTCILSQAVFAGMVLDQIKTIFGSEIVERSVDESKKFLSSITDLANIVTGKTKKETGLINQTNPQPTIVPVKSMLLH